MKTFILAGLTAAVVVAAPVAHAQTVGVGVGPVGVGINLGPEQRTVIREYVTRERPIELRERVVVGATLPEEVELRSVPQQWGPDASRYRYVYSNDRVYFVEPSSRRVVHVID